MLGHDVRSDEGELQAVNEDITQKYLCDFRLVWRSLLDRLYTVTFESVGICATNPEVLVDAVRSICLLDAVVEVLPIHWHLQLDHALVAG